jgi:hypothetical protein
LLFLFSPRSWVRWHGKRENGEKAIVRGNCLGQLETFVMGATFYDILPERRVWRPGGSWQQLGAVVCPNWDPSGSMSCPPNC